MLFETKKSIENKLKKLGYKKVYDNSNLIVQFEINVEKYNYTQCVDILHKHTGKHILQSYEKGKDDMVGLEFTHLKLFMKYFKKLGW